MPEPRLSGNRIQLSNNHTHHCRFSLSIAPNKSYFLSPLDFDVCVTENNFSGIAYCKISAFIHNVT